MTNDSQIFDRIKKNLTWRTVDNIHWNRLAATAQALCEVKGHGKEYAGQVVRNSKALARALDDGGLRPLFRELGYTASHQIMLDPEELRTSRELDFNSMAIILENSNIITDAVGRLGTNEVTRLGTVEEDMEVVAGLVIRALNGENVQENVIGLRKNMNIEFC